MNMPQPKTFFSPTSHNWVRAPCCGESRLRMVASATSMSAPPSKSSHWSRLSWMSGSLRVERRFDGRCRRRFDGWRVLDVVGLLGFERLLVIIFYSAGALYLKVSRKRQVNGFVDGAHWNGFYTLRQARFLTPQCPRHEHFAESQACGLFDTRFKLPHRPHLS